MVRRLWNDQGGFIISAELVLVATIVVIGMIVGLVSVRNQVVQELVDVGQSIGSLSQSYAFTAIGPSGTQGQSCSFAWTDGSYYLDLKDYCQAPQTTGNEPGGISVRLWPVGAPQVPPGGEQ
jgi:hypothetical protein